MIRGSHEAFEELYFIYVKAIRANIAKMIRQPEDINDVMQEVFVKLWQHKDRLDRTKGVADWLYVVSFNQSIQFLRKKLRTEGAYSSTIDLSVIGDELPTDDVLETRLPLIQEAIEKLPERKRLAFRQCRIEGNSLDEVAAAMGITKEAVKGYLKDAKNFILAYVHENERSSSLLPLLLVFFLR
ncbi:DNA-directed RNA polymerase sigma-70 factor [Puia dinghuensis]|uniref:DNA-directed RNA polymerase sigma-70 factor n=2 Tax=Puia dinghuensis TaxID=1792502 RepID=A0A8J2UKV5_9BACT|nr:DNA-directed RNA polymerase sigma-70 factor [Puia dinghuensis]